MERLVKIAHVVALILSVLFLPSYVSVVLIVLLLALWRMYALALLSALLIDVLFGAPIPMLFGITYFYTMIVLLLMALTYILDRALLE